MEYSIGPDGEVLTPTGRKINPEDHPAWDWNRNKPSPDLDGCVPVEYTNASNGDILKPDGSKINPEDHPGWDWTRSGHSLARRVRSLWNTQLHLTEKC